MMMPIIRKDMQLFPTGHRVGKHAVANGRLRASKSASCTQVHRGSSNMAVVSNKPLSKSAQELDQAKPAPAVAVHPRRVSRHISALPSDMISTITEEDHIDSCSGSEKAHSIPDSHHSSEEDGHSDSKCRNSEKAGKTSKGPVFFSHLRSLLKGGHSPDKQKIVPTSSHSNSLTQPDDALPDM